MPFAAVLRMARSSASWSLVKVWSTSTRSAKPISWPRSCGRRRRAKPTAAVLAVAILSSMLALVSSRSDSAIGTFARSKYVMSCLTPSSKMLSWSGVRSVMYRPDASVTVTLSETTSTPARNDGGCCARTVAARAMATASARPAAVIASRA